MGDSTMAYTIRYGPMTHSNNRMTTHPQKSSINFTTFSILITLYIMVGWCCVFNTFFEVPNFYETEIDGKQTAYFRHFPFGSVQKKPFVRRFLHFDLSRTASYSLFSSFLSSIYNRKGRHI